MQSKKMLEVSDLPGCCVVQVGNACSEALRHFHIEKWEIFPLRNSNSLFECMPRILHNK
jgi:hypothetical protein